MVRNISALYVRYQNFLRDLDQLSHIRSYDISPNKVAQRAFLYKEKVLSPDLEKIRAEILRDVKLVIDKIAHRFTHFEIKKNIKQEELTRALDETKEIDGEIKQVEKLIADFSAEDKAVVSGSFSLLREGYSKRLVNTLLWEKIFKKEAPIVDDTKINKEQRKLVIKSPKKISVNTLQGYLSDLIRKKCTNIFVVLKEENTPLFSDASLIDLAILSEKGEHFFALFKDGKKRNLAFEVDQDHLTVKIESAK